MPLAIISPLTSSAMNFCHAATAASHACCIAGDMGAGFSPVEGASGPQCAGCRRVQRPLEVAPRSGATAGVKELCRVLVTVTPAARWRCTASILMTRSRNTS